MKYFFIVGERSGDQHASALIKEIKKRDDSAIVAGWGGHLMESAGADILTSYHDISIMGFLEVVRNLRVLKERLKACQDDIIKFDPDVVVLVDFPGFNLRMAKFAKTIGKKTCYYISPKVWAWKSDRIKTIRNHVDEVLVIFPFEEVYYKKQNLKVTYVGNPSLEGIQDHIFDDALIAKLRKQGKNIAFLPGSRIQEVKSAIDVITKLSSTYDDYHFLVAGVDNIHAAIYEPLKRLDNVTLLYEKTYEVLRASEVAIVTSGTASLEAALLNVPQVVVYKTSTLSFVIARLLIKVRFISLVNLIAGRKVVKELIQGSYDPVDIATELEYLLNDHTTKKRISEGYSEIRKLIGNKRASDEAAQAIIALGSS